MSFRRTKSAASEARAWSKFVQEHFDLLVKTGLPASIFESHEMWDYFLMDGYVPGDPTATCFRDLNVDQKKHLEGAIVEYLRAGFGDPGLALFGRKVEDRIFERAKT